MVLFQKPPDDAQPSGKTEKLTKPPVKPDDRPAPPASTPPGGRTRPEVARLESDDALLRRLSQELFDEALKRWQEQESIRDPAIRPTPKPQQDSFQVPPLAPVSEVGKAYVTKSIREGYPAMRSLTEPDYVVHRRLYFEDKNSERYGWDVGIAQPFVSALYFYTDVLFWPAQLASNPHERYETSAGKCLPGSPVPYYLYPPEIDLWGVAAQAGIITGAAFALP
jgi:hypothetical protein